MPAEQLDLIVRAGMAAPTAVNVQPWSFVIVTDRALLDRLDEGLPFAKMLQQAGATVIVCGLPEKGEQFARDYWVQDCAAATENIPLAAHSLGLGAVWRRSNRSRSESHSCARCSSCPPRRSRSTSSPSAFRAPPPEPKDKFTPANLHWNRWGGSRAPA